MKLLVHRIPLGDQMYGDKMIAVDSRNRSSYLFFRKRRIALSGRVSRMCLSSRAEIRLSSDGVRDAILTTGEGQNSSSCNLHLRGTRPAGLDVTVTDRCSLQFLRILLSKIDVIRKSPRHNRMHSSVQMAPRKEILDLIRESSLNLRKIAGEVCSNQQISSPH